jgi:hypothetical protein
VPGKVFYGIAAVVKLSLNAVNLQMVVSSTMIPSSPLEYVLFSMMLPF